MCRASSSIGSRRLRRRRRFELEYRHRRQSDGQYYWFLTRTVPVIDGSGRLTQWIGTSTEITRQKQTEEALSQSQQRLKALFDNTQDAILLADDQAQYVEANAAAASIDGIQRRRATADVGARTSRRCRNSEPGTEVMARLYCTRAARKGSFRYVARMERPPRWNIGRWPAFFPACIFRFCATRRNCAPSSGNCRRRGGNIARFSRRRATG